MEGTVSKKDIFLNLALCGAPTGLLDVWMKFITVAVHCNCIFETTLTLTLFLFLRKCKHWFRLLWQGEILHILFSFLIWSKESFLFSLARPASGERLTSLEESLVRCFAFYKTSSKTSGAMFLKNIVQSIASLIIMYPLHKSWHDCEWECEQPALWRLPHITGPLTTLWPPLPFGTWAGQECQISLLLCFFLIFKELYTLRYR